MSISSKSFSYPRFMLCCLLLFAASQPLGVSAQQPLSESSLPTLTNSIGMTLVQIPAGRFSMGSPASEPGSEEHELLHKVELSEPYFLGITEVTEHQWALVMEDAFRTEEREVRDPETNRLVRKEEVQIRNPKLDSQLPITNISWRQAVEFCERLSQLPEEKKEGRNYRLPTEAEWEHACRAGTSTAYSFGDDRALLSTYAWQGVRQPQLVGQKTPNAWGLYDMHGNVAEWCFDCYGTYPEGLVSDPIGPEELLSLERVIRGGSFDRKESQCRSGWRSKASPGFKASTLGFRVVLGRPVGPSSLPSVINSIGQHLVTIPAGRFMMGSEKGEGIERPVHEVTISRPFAIASTEVTQGQWKEVMGTEPWKGQSNVKEGADYAANYISWIDAVEFCRRLTLRPEEQAAGRTYRLPTEAEWEYACRAGMKTEYNFGDDAKMLGEFAWYAENGPSSSPQIVGQKEPNVWGLYDMHGNVREWCIDWYANYPKGLITDPVGPEKGSSRVLRGGGWFSTAGLCRSASRYWLTPDDRYNNLGFRLVSVSQ
ncbi:formylglycine-generating enzyme family protein [Pirellulaceae bacterium SH449]